jgi:anthranilate/para-aminobenzoate synthase component II
VDGPLGHPVLMQDSNPGQLPRVGVLTPAGEDAEPYMAAVRHGEGEPVAIVPNQPVPLGVGGLLVGGSSRLNPEDIVPAALVDAIDRDLPVLGVGWGMHVLNHAVGGGTPRAVEGCSDTRKTVFISPGGKLSYTIAGSGWVGIPVDHTHGLLPDDVADGMLASCYSEDRVVYAIEKPGHHWLIGVQWHAERVDSMPSSFDSLLLALVERSAVV